MIIFNKKIFFNYDAFKFFLCLRLTNLVVPLLIHSKGSIVNISSVNGIRSVEKIIAKKFFLF